MFAAREGMILRGIRVIVLLVAVFCIAPQTSTAQAPTDCRNTLSVCSNGTINESSNGPGINDFAFGGNDPGCLVTNEHQSVWLYVQIESGNTLGFDIIPNVFGEDYDFAVYGPNVDCLNLGTPTRCSYAAPFGAASTGMNGSNSDFTEGASGNGYVRWLNVTPGESYYVLIDNFSTSFQGFTLNWTGDGILDCSITLPCPVVDLGPNTSVCDGGTTELGRPTGPNDSYLWSTGETTPIIVVADSGLYWQEVTRNGCVERDSIYVSLAETPVIDLGNDTLLCEGQEIMLDASHPAATGYLWQDGWRSPLYTVTGAGTYSIEVFNDGCVGTDEIVVDYDPLPVVDLGSDTVLCNSNGILLVGTTAAATDYLWQDGSSGLTLMATQSGTYWVQTSNEACTYSDTIQVDFGVYPVYDLGEDQTLCEGATLTLNAFAPEGSNYLWQDGSNDFTLDVTTTGTYSVVVSNPECSVADDIEVTFLPFPEVDLGPDTTLCTGDTLNLDVTSPDASDYEWHDGSTDPQFTITAPGLYSIISTNDICSSTDSVVIAYNEYPIFSLGPDTLLCRGTGYPIVIDGESDYSYLWSDNSTANSFTVTEQGEYILEVENLCGVRWDTITVIYGSCNCDFFFPTGFTPNGDGLNDNYYPIVDCDSLQSYELEIFNRYGERLFISDDIDESWPGLDDAKNYMMDAYVWQVHYIWSWRGKPMIRRENGHFAIIR